MSASLGLYRLQQVDRQIDRARAQLDVIHKTLENDSELRDALSKVETAQTDHHRVSPQHSYAKYHANNTAPFQC